MMEMGMMSTTQSTLAITVLPPATMDSTIIATAKEQLSAVSRAFHLMAFVHIHCLNGMQDIVYSQSIF
jgi:hypothetical protein